jgi:hypothetical protein
MGVNRKRVSELNRCPLTPNPFPPKSGGRGAGGRKNGGVPFCSGSPCPRCGGKGSGVRGQRSRPLCNVPCRTGLITAAVCALGLLSAMPAAATPQPPTPEVTPEAAPEPPEVQDARDAYKLGISLIKQGQWSDALAAFERSARLKPAAVTAFNIGYCERALGRFTRARKSFSQALGAGELPADKAVEARGYLAEIESRLVRALTTLSPAGASVAVDGRPLDAAIGDAAHAELVAGTRDPGPPEVVGAPSFTVVLDPGTHVFVVSAPGHPDVVLTRELAPGATATLALALSPPAPPTPTDRPAPAGPARRLGAVIAFGAGGASAVAGAVFGALALKKKGELDGTCPQKNQCPSSEQGTIDAMSTFATVSTIGLTAAVAGAGVGTILLLTGDRPAAPRAGTTLSIGPGYAAVRGWF